VKSESAIRREIKALKALDTSENSEGVRIQANSMVFALEWALGKWGMSWSAWLKACQRESEKRRVPKT
jgi:hypothetical protein